MTTSYKGTFDFPVCLWSVAQELGVLRERSNEHLYETHPEYYRGNARKRDRVAVLGVLGELVARHHLCSHRANFTAAPLLAERPEVAADIVNYGARLDVKAVPYYGRYLLVNEAAHRKAGKEVDLYWFLRIINQHQAEHYWAPFDEVSAWPVMSFGYAPAFYREIALEHQQKEAV
jgi:hypothetical protein